MSETKIQIQATEVFEKNWDAINELKEDGTKRYKLLINEGSSRSSKTWSFFQIIFLLSYYHKRKRVIVLRETAVDCRENVEQEFMDWMADPMGRIQQHKKGEITTRELDVFLEEENLSKYVLRNKTHHTHTFHNSDSRIIFSGADNVNKIIGKSNDIIWINEPYGFPESVLLQLLQRCNDFMLIDWNPKEKHYIDERLKARDHSKVIHSTFRDNPFCPEQQKQEILSRLPLSSDFIKLKTPGLTPESFRLVPDINTLLDHLSKITEDQRTKEEIVLAWNNERQKTADPYLWAVFGLGIQAEKPNKIYHNWTKCSFGDFDAVEFPSVYGIDWGVVHKMGIVEVKYYDGTFYVHELAYVSEEEIILELIGIYGNNYQEELKKMNLGVITWHLKRLGIKKSKEIICDSANPDKIVELMTEGYNAFPAYKPAGSVYSGISMVKRANIVYTDCSYNIETEYNSYEWKTDRYELVTEEPIKKLDDLLDPFRYVATSIVTNLSLSI